MTQPNILFLFSDQHRYDCVGANGHPFLQTPHMDRLAADGMRFTHAFCPIPVCIPVRNSLMHGQWATEHGVIANWDTEARHCRQAGLPTWSMALRDAGYTLGYVGKWHTHPTLRPADYGFSDYVPEGDYAVWRAAQGLPPRPRRNGFFGDTDDAIAPAQSRLAWGADHTIALLERYAAAGRPFFLRWDTSEPHLPNVVPEPYASMYPPATIPPWPSFPDSLAGKPYMQAQQRRTWGIDGWGWDKWAPIVARYLGELTLMDAQIGRILAALDALGLAESTLVIYTSEHGDLCGGHGMIDKHYVMYDDLTRVPLIMRWPGRIAPGTCCDAFVSHALDLATTFCELAGAPVPETFRGLSLLPLLAGASDNGRMDIYATYHGNQFGLYSERMVRDRRWKYVWNATAEDELYDLEADPGELHNLAADPAARDGLARLRRRLVAWMEATHDPLLNGWTRAQLLEGRKV
mgnify:CR=1 FL=1